MPLCDNPLWPCAMTGAVSCLAGFEDLAIVIHGSSGCYFYPASLLQTTIYGTHLLESDVIFGSEHRLQEVIGEIGDGYRAVAVVTTCVPSLVGEDIRAILAGVADVVVDAPGFLGSFEDGYQAALHALGSRTDPDRKGVNIEGLNPIDPYYRGNIRETQRLFALSGLPYATLFCADRYDALSRSA
ncbi:MAG: nitrogenase component 1, partial [Methanomicrobiales archaeon]|nr:nitrogenase component 1 [Methanomicrobiales archaeon]